ncbi:hypothetical protein B0A54_12228 [Friedmanniomyces endolithicus]|uniref:EF-hand domain-containing protein n=1 Tax=Friedmanniomyces endolithicus TaxID=329885 RepID=A0A4U0UJX0_9PEZI|nr:hypothetical protein LTS09_016149 [Friedmanniomyces endolithicus]TKA36003.1 hypothetical protein B0A54_12228 [Friedmanniomyces endolithicus]
MSSVRPLSFNDSGRQSPFARKNSASPATVRATTPTRSPSKVATSLSPTKNGSLSPEKASPFVRRPSQISHTDRPSSPFARPISSLSIPTSPSRQVSNASNISRREVTPEFPRPLPSATREATPPSPQTSPLRREETPTFVQPTPPREPPSPSPFDGPALDSPSTTKAPPSQANLRPSVHRIPTSSTISTIKAPIFAPTTKTSTSIRPQLSRGLSNHNNASSHLLPSLIHTLHESFHVLDPTASGHLTPATLTSTLEQLGLPNDPSTLCEFFPPSGPAHLTLAKYLDSLSAPLASLSHPDELRAAFEAFDTDDSGQIDVGELRRALLSTAPEPGQEESERLSEREVDGILREFTSRRHFGGSGFNGNRAVAKGEVFRYRDFMAGISGGAGSGAGVVAS